MSTHKPSRTAADPALGSSDAITRRDFLDAVLLASGAVLVTGATPLDLLADDRNDFDGYSGIGDYARANGNTFDVVTTGHKLRDGTYAGVDPGKARPAGSFDCVIVGGGISGLAAALFFHRRTEGRGTCLVLEDHTMFGGLARANEFEVNGERLVANQASAMFFPPLAGTFLSEFYPSIGIDLRPIAYQTWIRRWQSAGRRTSRAAAHLRSISARASDARRVSCSSIRGARGWKVRRSPRKRAVSS